MQEEKVGITIYFPKSIMELIEKRVEITERSKTAEVLHLIKLGLTYGHEADLRALSQLNLHLPKSIEQL